MVAIEENSAACVIYDNSDDVINLLNVKSSSLHLDTKYYTVSVSIITPPSPTTPPPTSLPINAVVVKDSFDRLVEIAKLDFFASTAVRLFIAPEKPDSSQFQFCFDNEIEYLDIEEEPERVLEALEQCEGWPGMKMKSAPSRQAPPQAQQQVQAPAPTVQNLVEMGSLHDELDHLDSLEDDFGALLSLVARTRGAGANLSDSQRRENAEKVALALEALLGGDDSD